MNVAILIIILTIIIIVAIFLITGLTGAPYVPTLKPGLKQAFRNLYHLSKKDLLIDLGSGDGVVLAEATKCGARAIGIELNPILAAITKYRYRKNPYIEIKCSNFYSIKFPKETTVVYAFAVSLHINLIYQKIKDEATRLDKPLYFISNAFDIPGIEPEGQVSTFYLYKVTPEDKDGQ